MGEIAYIPCGAAIPTRANRGPAWAIVRGQDSFDNLGAKR